MSDVKGPRSYVEMLDDVLSGVEQRVDNPLRPSNAGTCARRIAYDFAAFLGIIPVSVESRKPSVNRLLNLGHFVEKQVVDDFKLVPDFKVKYTQQEVDIFTLPYGTEVIGHTDIALFAEGYAGVGDVKTIGDRWDSGYSSKWDHLLDNYRRCPSAQAFGENSFWVENLGQFLNDIGTEDSLYKNLIQLNLYACSDFLKKKGVDHAFILRYNKNNSKIMEIRFAPSDEVFESTRNRFADIEAVCDHQDPRKVPKERLLGSMDCAYCPYAKECWPKVSKSELFASAPKKQWATKAEDMESADTVTALIEEYLVLEAAGEQKDRAERNLILALDNAGVSKVKCNGVVLEVKHLKSGSVVRRGKE